MKHVPALVLTVVLCGLTATLVAHEVTYKGTVVTAKPTSLSVKVVDDKTKLAKVMVFEIDKDTEIRRGDKVVSFADAKIQKDEDVSVMVNLDDGADYAEEIRLAIRK